MIKPRIPSSAADIGDHYDELDDFYRQIWGEHLHHGLWTTGRESVEVAVIKLLELVAEAAHVDANTRVCDVGAGYGAAARYLSDTHGARVTAITISPAQHRYAVSRGSADETIDYVLGDWFENEFQSQSFDAVIAIESLAHMEDKVGFFREAQRVLRPDGRLVVCAWLAAEKPTRHERRYLLEPICREGRLPGLGNRIEYRKWMKEAGFEVETEADLSDQVQKTWAICMRRTLAQFFRDARYIRFLLDSSKKNRRFLLTLPRMWTAYQIGALRYGLFTARRP